MFRNSNETIASGASQFFAKSFEYYSRAHALHTGHYPAINMAAIRLYQAAAEYRLGRPNDARVNHQDALRIAQQLLDTRSSWPIVLENDHFWHLATEAEAHYLIGNIELSGRLYEQVKLHPQCTDRHLNFIEAQRMRNEELVTLLAAEGLAAEGPA